MRLFLLLLCPLFVSAQSSSTTFKWEIAQHRQQYKLDFLTEPRSPLKAQDTAFLDFFEPDLEWRIKARFVSTPDAIPFDLPTYSGKTKQYRQYGELIFEKAGKTHRLQLYQSIQLAQMEAYRDYLFLPFKDLTNAAETYGGGRYLDFRMKEIEEVDGSAWLWIDFNKCYNPYCAFSDGYNCPVPPVENHLDLRVDAGERNFKGEKKH